jgi:hypothetical protein
MGTLYKWLLYTPRAQADRGSSNGPGVFTPDTPPPPPRDCLDRRVRGFQAVLEGSIPRVGEPMSSVSRQGRSSPTSAERSRAVSLVTSVGSCGPTYGSRNLRGTGRNNPPTSLGLGYHG